MVTQRATEKAQRATEEKHRWRRFAIGAVTYWARIENPRQRTQNGQNFR